MSFSDNILDWFELHGRKNLPWQNPATPYRVWISEIMLQQTQVKTVIPYFEKFIDAFPDISTLAQADIDEVLAHWSGLGYYARARNLHKSATIMHTEFQSSLPQSIEGLESLPGIGRSTAGAILSLGHKRYGAILDGNVKRVLARHFGIEGWTGKTSVQKQLWQIAEAETPETNFGSYNQAMMDMGATICTRSKPKCEQCPIYSTCLALSEDRVSELPTPKPKKMNPKKHSHMLLCLQNNQPLAYFEKRPPVGIWGGLWSLPEVSKDRMELWLQQQGLELINGDIESTTLLHKFSHFDLNIEVSKIHVKSSNTNTNVSEPDIYQWLNTQDALGLPAPIKKILKYWRL